MQPNGVHAVHLQCIWFCAYGTVCTFAVGLVKDVIKEQPVLERATLHQRVDEARRLHGTLYSVVYRGAAHMDMDMDMHMHMLTRTRTHVPCTCTHVACTCTCTHLHMHMRMQCAPAGRGRSQAAEAAVRAGTYSVAAPRARAQATPPIVRDK